MMERVQAQDVGLDDRARGGVIHFELPSQPLAQALQTYSRTANVAVIALDRQLDGHFSAPVIGDFVPRDALQHLLTGTGFAADFTGASEAVIVPTTVAPASAPSPSDWSIAASAVDGVADREDFAAYAALIQARVTEALCASSRTRPGSYRLVAQLRIDAMGSIVASKVVGSTGLPGRDAAIEQAIGATVLDAAPPPGLPEPITILLHPDSDGVHTYCVDAVGRE